MTARLVQVPDYQSAEWEAERRKGLGASEIPSIVPGTGAYIGEYELWARKTGRSEQGPPSFAMRLGSRAEGLALDWFEESTGLPVVRGETWHDDRWPRCWATLDGRVEGERRGVEVKMTSRRWPDDGPPRHVRIQCLAQMAIADLDRVDVVRVAHVGEPTVHALERDGSETVLMDWAEEWWERHVVADSPPPLDGSDPARRALAAMRGEGEMVASAAQAEWMRELRQWRSAEARAGEAADRLVRDLKASMAGHGTLVGDGFRASWVPVRGRVKTDWRAVATAYRGMVGKVKLSLDAGHTAHGDCTCPEHRLMAGWDMDAIESLHTVTGEPGDQFRPTWDEEG